MRTYTLRATDYGVIPNHERPDRERTWLVCFGPIHARFAEEPEHRAIEALMEHYGADHATILPPRKPPVVA